MDISIEQVKRLRHKGRASAFSAWARCAIRAGAGFLMGAAGFAGFSPLALPVAVSAWFGPGEPYSVLTGALMGALVCGNWASFTACALFSGAEMLFSLSSAPERGNGALARRLLLMGGAQAAVLPFIWGSWGLPLVMACLSLASSPLLFLVASGAERSLRRLVRGRRLARRDALVLALAAALVLAALVLAPRAAAAFASLFVLAAAAALYRERALSAETLEKTRSRLRDAASVARELAAMFAPGEAERGPVKSQLLGLGCAMEQIAEGGGALFCRRINVSLGTAAAAMPGSEETGDAFAVRRNGDELLLILGDGMGSGAAAHRESAGAAALMGDMLSIGFGHDEAADSVNGLLLLSGDEMYTTLDVARINLASAEARFMKFGAPPAYLLREGSVRSIESPAPPAGILPGVRAGASRSQLKNGDALILMTDGLYDALGMELIASIVERVGAANTAQDAADALISAGLERYHNDDMSVMVARIESA